MRAPPVLAVVAAALFPLRANAQDPPPTLPAPAAETVPASAPAPAPAPAPSPAPPRPHRDDIEFGLSPLLLLNVHWLDAPGDRRVSAAGVSGVDGVYPGFIGADVAWGVMADVRFLHFVGAEIDVLRQSDFGVGTASFENKGVPCIIRQNGSAVAVPGPDYAMTIGQGAWHLPLLAKLSIPKDEHWRDGDEERVETVRAATFALGPEVVFPDGAQLTTSPNGLCYPMRAKASPYVMYTAALGAEWRLMRDIDLRFLGSLRASYNPGPGDAVSGRGEYGLVGSQVQPLSYSSEWRYQLAVVLGLGVFF